MCNLRSLASSARYNLFSQKDNDDLFLTTTILCNMSFHFSPRSLQMVTDNWLFTRFLDSTQEPVFEVISVTREDNTDAKPNANSKAQHDHNNCFDTIQNKWKSKIDSTVAREASEPFNSTTHNSFNHDAWEIQKTFDFQITALKKG